MDPGGRRREGGREGEDLKTRFRDNRGVKRRTHHALKEVSEASCVCGMNNCVDVGSTFLLRQRGRGEKRISGTTRGSSLAGQDRCS